MTPRSTTPHRHQAAPVILVAVDDDEALQMLRKAFDEAGVDSSCHFAFTGDAVINHLWASTQPENRAEFPLPDLLFLQLRLPGKTGLDVLEWIESQPDFSPPRVVVLAAWEEFHDVNEAYRLGAWSFLPKPFHIAEVCRIIADVGHTGLEAFRSS